MRITLLTLILGAALAGSLASCCEPASKDSQPVLVDSLFSRTTVWDFDRIASDNNVGGAKPDSGYYPIYTFGIANTGSQDDDFTLRVRSQYMYSDGTPVGFDITRTVPAHSTVLFRTPTAIPDSITSLERITYTRLQDTIMSQAYLGFFAPTQDSTKLRYENATVSVMYGGIDNGPESCNTPATEKTLNLAPILDR